MSTHLRRPSRGVAGSSALTTTGSSSGVESGGLRSRLAGFAISLALSTPRGPRRTASTGRARAQASTAEGDPGRPGTLLHAIRVTE
jgi:hypothetical protein